MVRVRKQERRELWVQRERRGRWRREQAKERRGSRLSCRMAGGVGVMVVGGEGGVVEEGRQEKALALLRQVRMPMVMR